MSKSRPEYVVDPLDAIKKYSADSLRMFLVSVASPDSDFNWSDKGMQGSHKFILKLFDFFNNLKNKIGKSTPRFESKINKTIKEVSEDIEKFRYNLAIIKLRGLFDSLFDESEVGKKDLEGYLKLISVFCPHIAEELWEKLGNKGFISLEKWPVADEKKINEKFEKEEKAIEDLIGDIRNILKILEGKGEKKKSIKVFVIPKEIELYKSVEEKIERVFGMDTELLSITEASKTGKVIKAKPGKPGIYLE